MFFTCYWRGSLSAAFFCTVFCTLFLWFRLCSFVYHNAEGSTKMEEKSIPFETYNIKLHKNCVIHWQNTKHSPSTSENLTRKNSGTLSSQSISKIKFMVNVMCDAAKPKKVYSKLEDRTYNFKISFITLTLSNTQTHSDNYIRKFLLEPFIRTCRRKYNMVTYIWKAESQFNGNIHFHITTDTFIHHKQVRKYWNKLQRKHGYINTNDDPPSTEIKSVKSIKNLPAYLCKYISKNQSYAKIFSLHCSTDDKEHFYRSELYSVIEDGKKMMWQQHRKVHCKLYDASSNLKSFNTIISEWVDWKRYYKIKCQMMQSHIIKWNNNVAILRHNDASLPEWNSLISSFKTNTDTYHEIASMF